MSLSRLKSFILNFPVLSLPNYLVLALVGFYRFVLKPFFLKPPTCRFDPSCSVYAYTCFKRFSFFKAFKLSLARLLKCHPWGVSGYDPVPCSFCSNSKKGVSA